MIYPWLKPPGDLPHSGKIAGKLNSPELLTHYWRNTPNASCFS
jgi:hypothetical protein